MERLIFCRILTIDEQNGSENPGHAQELEQGDVLPEEQNAQGGGHKGLDRGQNGGSAGFRQAKAISVEYIGDCAA